MEKGYDLLVVGAGIAGCEAAWRASGLGAEVLLLTMSLDQVNLPGYLPALFLAREEAFLLEKRLEGTLFGEALARSCMGAYEIPPGQEAVLVFDRREFSLASKELIERRKGLDARQALVKSLHRADFVSVESVFGETFKAGKAVIAPGCYLKGRVRTGRLRLKSGRYGDLAADGLAESLEKAGLRMKGWSGSVPAVVDQRRLGQTHWKRAERLRGYSAPEPARSGKGHEERPVLWSEKEGVLYLLVPLGPRSHEAFILERPREGGGPPPWAEGALVRMPVEQECLVLAGKNREKEQVVYFAGSFNGAWGYLECAEDGSGRALEALGKGA